MRIRLALFVLISDNALISAWVFPPRGKENSLNDSPSFIVANSKLDELQQQAGHVVASFEPKEFNPIPLLNNCHIQTIGSFFVRDIPECANVRDPVAIFGALLLQSRTPGRIDESDFLWQERKRFETPDGDFFDVDYSYCCKSPSNTTPSSNGVVVILHGLESNSKSSLTQQMAKAFRALDLDVCCINFRGCSGEPNRTIGGYHLGFTSDLIFFLDSITATRNCTTPIYLAGFSLGGNCVLKALGELQASAVESYNIQGAVAFCVPVDNERNAPFLGQPGINRMIYTNNLLKTLRQKAQVQLNQFCNGDEATTVFDYFGAINAETITDFDDAFIAPIYGFDNAQDYYRKTSSLHFLEKIAVPTLLLNAKDDPFMDPDFFPFEKSREYGGLAPVKMVRTNHGGHLGYIFHQQEGDTIAETSWGPAEMARFLRHVMDARVEHRKYDININA